MHTGPGRSRGEAGQGQPSPGDPGEPAVTDVFDEAGAYLGTAHGMGLPLGWLGDDRVLFAIENDETGVSVIGIFRIADGAPAS